jgi:hypothetical protein
MFCKENYKIVIFMRFLLHKKEWDYKCPIFSFIRLTTWRQLGGEKFLIFPPKFEIRTPQFVKSIQVLDY